MADSKRRGEDAVDEHLDEVFSDAAADDADVEDLDDDFDDDDEPVAASSRSSRTAARTASKAATPKSAKGPKVDKTVESAGLFDRIARFIREVVAELRKVNWPSRNELLTYTTVVVGFVVVMMGIVAGLDYGFAWLVTHVFG